MKLIRALAALTHVSTEVLRLIISWIMIATVSLAALFVYPRPISFIPITYLMIATSIVLFVRLRRRRAARTNG